MMVVLLLAVASSFFTSCGSSSYFLNLFIIFLYKCDDEKNSNISDDGDRNGNGGNDCDSVADDKLILSIKYLADWLALTLLCLRQSEL